MKFILPIIELDEQHDVAYVYLAPGTRKRGSVHRTLKAADDVLLDFDKTGRLIGIEMLKPSAYGWLEPKLLNVVGRG